MKKLLLATTMAIMAALSAHPFTVDGVTYSTSNGVATVTGASNKAITKLTIPATVTYRGTTYPVNFMEGNAFWNCTSLRELVIEDSETYIGTNFVSQSSGTSSLIQLGDPFRDSPLEKIYVGRNLANRLNNGGLQSVTPISSTATSVDLTIAGNATFIPQGISGNTNTTFINRTNITSLTIGGNVENVYNKAFSGCTGLKKVTLLPGETKTKFESNTVFEKCSIDSLIISRTFINNSAIKPTVIIISKDCNWLEQNSFNGINIQKVVIADSENEIEIDNQYPIFTDCEIDSLYYGRVLKDQSNNIKNTAKIKNVVFGPNITNITQNYIYDHPELLSVSMSQNVTKIDDNAFKGCSALKEIYTKSTTPPACESNHTFPTEVYDSAVLTVPAGSKKAYRAAEVWKLFKNIQSEGGGFKITVTCDSSLGEVALNGSNVAEITVDEDEPLSIAITPIEGYKVAKMTVNGTDVTGLLVDNAIAYESIDSNMDIVVEFDIITFAVNLPAGLTGGRIIVNNLETAPATVDYGSRLEIAAVADRGYELAAFSVNGTDVIESLDENGAYVIGNVTADINVEAAFEPIIYTVTAVNRTDYGTLTLNGGAGDCKVAFGQPLVIGVMPRDEGCYLVALTVDGTDVTADVTGGTYTVETVEADMTVEAVFGFYTYTVELGYDPAMGTIIPDQPGGDSDVTVAHGTTLRLTVLPAEGYEIATVTLDGNDVTGRVDDNGVLTLENVTAPHRVEATFEIKRVRLSVLGLQGGQLAMRYDYGTEVTLLVEPEDGWEFHSLTVGDTTVTELESDDSYTTPALTDDTAVSVVFKLAGQSGADLPADAQMITVSTRSTTVIVTGAHDGEQVEVYDTAGVAVYRGTEHEIDLNRQGVHIVRVSGLTFKVMLK